jgi:hypothetical protein
MLFRELRIIGLHARFVGCNLRLHPVEATLYNLAVGTFTTGRDLCTISANATPLIGVSIAITIGLCFMALATRLALVVVQASRAMCLQPG